MRYRIATGDAEGRATHWFASFLAHINWAEEDNYILQKCMDRCNSKASCDNFVHIGDIIEFESEEDFVVFKLKWS